MRLPLVRLLAGFFALTWLVFPGFGLIDLSVTWDEDWSVVLEGSWGLFMTVLVGGSFVAVAARPGRTAPAQVTLGVTLATWLLAAAAGLEWQLLGYVGVLVLQVAALAAVLPAREPVRPLRWEPWPPLLVLALLGAAPWGAHAWDVFRANRRNAGVVTGDVTMSVDHYAVQGALALALVTLAVLAAGWPRGRRSLGVGAGVCAGYLGLLSTAFPGQWGGFSPVWSLLCLGWGLALVVLAVVPLRSEAGQLRGQVVEAQRAL
ncbi:UNVERIFIED_ORG: hypothetical protein E4P37_15855 [Bacillus sp. AZ43]